MQRALSSVALVFVFVVGACAHPAKPLVAHGPRAFEAARSAPVETDPSAPSCPGFLGWNGVTCVSVACGEGRMFRRGYGCFGCFGECDDPVLRERTVESTSAAAFDAGGAQVAIEAARLFECDADRSLREPVTVEISPSGRVSRFTLGDEDEALRGCVAGRLERVRVPAFGGGAKVVSSFDHVVFRHPSRPVTPHSETW